MHSEVPTARHPQRIRVWTPLDLGLVSLLVVTGVCLRLYWGLDDHGIYHPDEIYQVLEPAHRLVYGFGMQSWEWEVGARNWTLPALLAGVLGLGRLLGVDQPESYLNLVRGLTAVLSSVGGFAVFALARHHASSRLFSLVAVLLFLFNPVMMYLGYHPFSEVLSTPFILFGLALSLRADHDSPRGRRALALGLSLLGIAVLLRLQNAIFVVSLAGAWRLSAERARYVYAMRVLTGWALLYGVVDWITWGVPFQSAGEYIKANLFLDVATRFYGADSPFFFVQVLWDTTGVVGILLLVLPLLAARRAGILLACALIFLVAHSLFPHKETRFIYALVPLLAALSGIGLQQLADWLGAGNRTRAALPRLLAVLVTAGTVAAISHSAWHFSDLRFGQLGAARLLLLPADTSAFHYPNGLNQLLMLAARQPDICGLFLVEHGALSGGYTYFHRNVPFFHNENPPQRPEMANYVISATPVVAALHPVATRGSYTLFATGRDSCEVAERFRPQLFAPDAPDAPEESK